MKRSQFSSVALVATRAMILFVQTMHVGETNDAKQAFAFVCSGPPLAFLVSVSSFVFYGVREGPQPQTYQVFIVPCFAGKKGQKYCGM